MAAPDRETAEEISQRLTRHLEALVSELLPGVRRDGRYLVCGSVYGEPGKSLQITTDGNRRGSWIDWASQQDRGDALDLVAVTRCAGDIGAAMRWATEWLGGDVSERRRPSYASAAVAPITSQAEHAKLSDVGQALWASTVRIEAGDVAGRYLEARGCALPHPDGDLRWLPRLRHPCGHDGPALIGLVTDSTTCERLTLHKTWIADDGSGRKAAVAKPRLLLAGHRKARGVIRLWPDDEVTLGLGVAEGIETALAMARRFTPVWACIDAGNLSAFPPLSGIECLTVAVDYDPAGVKAGDAVASAWVSSGHEVRRLQAPCAGEDIADWVAGGADATHR